MDVENDTMERKGWTGKFVAGADVEARTERGCGQSARNTTMMVTSGMYAPTMSFSTSSHERLAVQVIPEYPYSPSR